VTFFNSKPKNSAQSGDLDTSNIQRSEPISLYFHIPFCTKKCPYCHFYVIPNRPLFHQILEEGLLIEWEKMAPLFRDKEIKSIYFGGGTPTLFANSGLPKILGEIFQSSLILSNDCEITIEANPEDGSEKLFEHLLSLRINRLSLGIQSLDDRSLQTIERTHNAQKAKSTILAAAKAGFQNISIDLMYDLPDQTESSWINTLSQLENLPIQHVSLYNLTIEPHTSFYKRRQTLTFPHPETSLNFLNRAIETFLDLEFIRYEISAFAKKGYESKHNLGYWTGRPFLGFGPSAFSYWEGERFQNIAHLQRYTRLLKQGESPVDFREKLSFDQSIKERLAVQLRLLQGAEIKPDFPEDLKNTIDRLVEKNLLIKTGNRIYLSEKGLLFHDTIASEII
jgi:oxygen-independent coproporphyrinogen-3 oxidase